LALGASSLAVLVDAAVVRAGVAGVTSLAAVAGVALDLLGRRRRAVVRGERSSGAAEETEGDPGRDDLGSGA